MAKKKPKKSDDDPTSVQVYGEGAEVPEYILEDEEMGAAGLENMEARDMVIPRLIIMQGLSPAVVAGEAVIGEIRSSVTKEVILGRDEECAFIPIYHYKEWISWADRSSNEGILDRSMDPDSELAQAALRGDKREDDRGREVRVVTEYHNFAVLVPNISLEFPMILSCARTNHKKGRQLLALARYRGNRPLFAGKYLMSASMETNKAGDDYFVYDFLNAGFADAEEYNAAKALYEGLKEAYAQRRIVADHSDAGDAPEDPSKGDF